MEVIGDKSTRVLQFKIIDMGHARLLGDKANQKLPAAPMFEKFYRRYGPPSVRTAQFTSFLVAS